MADTKIALVCPAERVVVEWIEGEPGQRVDRELLRRNIGPRSHPLDEVGINAGHMVGLYAESKNGALMLCPTCGNVLVAGLEGQSIDAAIEDNFRLLLGHFSMPDPRKARRYKKGKPTPNELQLEPPSEKV